MIIGLKEPRFLVFLFNLFLHDSILFFGFDFKKRILNQKKTPESDLCKICLQRFTKNSDLRPRHLALVPWCHDASRATLGALGIKQGQLSSSTPGWPRLVPKLEKHDKPGFYVSRQPVNLWCQSHAIFEYNQNGMGKESKNVSLKTKAPRKSVSESFFM